MWRVPGLPWGDVGAEVMDEKEQPVRDGENPQGSASGLCKGPGAGDSVWSNCSTPAYVVVPAVGGMGREVG